MNTKVKLKELAIVVNEALSEYVIVHNRIFKEAATWRSVVKNLFGVGVPMSDLLAYAEQLVPRWDSIAVQIESFRIDYGSYRTDEEDAYLAILARYVAAVRRTIDALVARQRLLFEGNQGGRKKPMTWTTHKEKEAAYKAAVEAYLAVGRELNAANAVIFS